MRNYLDLLAREFSHPSDILWKARELEVLDHSLKKIDIEHPIIDIGCGNGKIVKVFFGAGFVDVGIDLDQEIVSQAKSARIYKRLETASVQDLPFEDQSFSTAISFVTLHLIEDINKTLSELNRIMKNGGLLIFTVPNDTFSSCLLFSKISKQYVKYRNEKLSNIYLLSRNEWSERLYRCGFIVEDIRGFIACKTVFYWDLIAFLVKFLPFAKRTLVHLLKFIYNEDLGRGAGGYLIIARKES